MNTNELVDKLAVDHEVLPKAKIRQLIEAAFAIVGDAVASGDDVTINGFGKFKAADRPAREGRNPATGQTIQIAASRKAAFSPAKQLRDKLNGPNGSGTKA